jgi:pimeloyl-ACP methyl ester carboxylesterase
MKHPTRRGAIASGALGVFAALSGNAAMAQAQTRKTFVLIHGAYHGGWCWQKVTAILEKQGHKVYAPSLTGLADRSHLLSTKVDLTTHITDIVNLFKWYDITDACLVPHSYGGWPASGAVEQIGDRVSSVVWLDAFMPKDGEASPTRSPRSAARRSTRRWPRANPAASRRRPTPIRSARKTTTG